MKKFTSYLFLILFLFNVLFYYPVFLLLQSEIRSDCKISTSKNIVIITLKNGEKTDWQWIDKKEFRHNGIMYDIVNTEVFGNKTKYYCVIDHKEMKLFKGLSRFIQGISDTQGTDRQDSKSPIKDYFKDFVTASKEHPLHRKDITSVILNSEKVFLSFIKDKISPPPELV